MASDGKSLLTQITELAIAVGAVFGLAVTVVDKKLLPSWVIALMVLAIAASIFSKTYLSLLGTPFAEWLGISVKLRAKKIRGRRKSMVIPVRVFRQDSPTAPKNFRFRWEWEADKIGTISTECPVCGNILRWNAGRTYDSQTIVACECERCKFDCGLHGTLQGLGDALRQHIYQYHYENGLMGKPPLGEPDGNVCDL